MPEVTKATFNLPSAELDQLKQLAKRRSISVTQALRQAIVSELFLQRIADRGAKLLVQEPDGTLQQLVFNQTEATMPDAHSEPAHA
ncbi:MAG: hypothetical protein JO227_21835 [Acetobacteraceae bacterium]|nr:hypothetical protein [Acetobacteraceae bacterium]